MLALLDCRSHACSKEVFSMSLAERILRQLYVVGVDQAILFTSNNQDISSLLRNDFSKKFRMRISRYSNTHLSDILNSQSADILLLEGDCLYDDRAIEFICKDESRNSALFNPKDPHSPIALHLGTDMIAHVKNELSDMSLALPTLLAHPNISRISVDSINPYIRFLRRYAVPTFRRIQFSDSTKPIENELYGKTFKGAMEFVAEYGYKIPVREMTRWVAKTTITPNMVTTVAILSAVAAIPCFFVGWYWAGLLLAATFIILDSLDGKLARLTYRLSHTADRFDHLTSLPTRMGWYAGLGWYFAEGQLTSPFGIAGFVLTCVPFMDKMVLNLFNWKFGRSLLDFTPLDRSIHLFTVRRNDIFFLIAASITGFARGAYLVITGWALLTWIWHIARLSYLSVSPHTAPDGRNRFDPQSNNTTSRSDHHERST